MTVSKIVAAAASGAGSDPVDVDDVFSTFIHTSTGSALNIQNGVDLTEGGLVWIKNRLTTDGYQLFDTERGVTKRLKSEESDAEATDSDEVTSFNSNGFSLGTGGSTNNSGGDTYVSWTWRKAPRFFDCVKYVGNGSTQTISHNLGSVPGMMLVKCRDNGGEWRVFHTSVGNTKGGFLAENLAFDDDVYWNDTTPTSTVFTVGNKSDTNGNGLNYIAYLFANNNGDGEFGPNGDQDIIKCGTYTGNGSDNGPTINLGFEPQFFMFTKSDNTGSWFVYDTMRGFTSDSSVGDDRGPYLNWDLNSAEATSNRIKPTPTGVKIHDSNDTWNQSGHKFIYMAIRRGSLNTPESASEVFAIDGEADTSPSPPSYNAPFIVDMFLGRRNAAGTDSWYLFDRTRGKAPGLIPNGSDAELNAGGSVYRFDRNDGIGYSSSNYYTNAYGWMFKRAPGFFDIVNFVGSGGSSQSITHNLGVAPEMIWVKRRDGASNWSIYHSALGLSKILNFATNAAGTGNQYWGTAAHTSSVFKVGSDSDTGASTNNYIAYLFATVAGVSKVGSFTFANSSGALNVDCGFSNGAKLVIFKRTNNTGDWYVVDSLRGITAGNDPYLRINANFAQNSSTELINPLSSGFTVQHNQGVVDGDYIFYAIAA